MRSLRTVGFFGLLAGLSLLLTACPGFVPERIPSLFVMYEAGGVCQGVMVTNHMGEQWRMWSYDRGNEEFVTLLPPGQTVRIPDPLPYPEITRYSLKGPQLLPLGQKVPIDISWHCLPDRPPERFTREIENDPSRYLYVREDPRAPSGLRIYLVLGEPPRQ